MPGIELCVRGACTAATPATHEASVCGGHGPRMASATWAPSLRLFFCSSNLPSAVSQVPGFATFLGRGWRRGRKEGVREREHSSGQAAICTGIPGRTCAALPFFLLAETTHAL